MDPLFKLRHEQFIERRHWPLPSRGQFELDVYDNGSATYFVCCDSRKKILASVRIHQTSKASLLADCFPELVETGEVLRSDDLYEGTRYFVNPKLRTRQSFRTVVSELNCAATEWIMAQGGRQSQAVIDFFAAQSFLEQSLRARPLGLARDYGGGPSAPGGGRCIAFRWDLTADLLADFRAYGQQPVPVAEDSAPDTIH